MNVNSCRQCTENTRNTDGRRYRCKRTRNSRKKTTKGRKQLNTPNGNTTTKIKSKRTLVNDPTGCKTVSEKAEHWEIWSDGILAETNGTHHRFRSSGIIEEKKNPTWKTFSAVAGRRCENFADVFVGRATGTVQNG